MIEPQACCIRLDDVIYRPATNEDGWECSHCGGKLGWRPDLDQSWLHEKIDAVLSFLELEHLVSVANGTMGDFINSNVERSCRDLNLFDQYTIIRQIMADPNLAGHSEYWAKRAVDPSACPHSNSETVDGTRRCLDCGQVQMFASVSQ